MRIIRILSLLIVIIISFLIITFAQGVDDKKEAMAGMAMKMMGMMQRQMVATNDGGVIVLAGNRLLKYDKDLNLLKEVELKTRVELKIDAGSIQEMIEKMKDKYSEPNKETKDSGQDKENK